MENNAQVKLTDRIREALMNYLYSEDSLEDAAYVETILLACREIDVRFKDLEDEIRELRRDEIHYKLFESNHLRDKLARLTNEETTST